VDSGEAMKVSVVIPAFNEAGRLEASIDRIVDYLRKNSTDWEIIVVDDGSKDGTADLVRQLKREAPKIQLISYDKNRGKGYAVRQGILAAKKEYVLITDADLAAPIEELKRLYEVVAGGHDGALGSREIANNGCHVEDHWLRRLAGRVFNWVVRLFVLRSFRDTQCGFKLFRKEPLKLIAKELKLDGFSFDVELLYLAKKLGMSVRGVGVNWAAQPGSKVRLYSDSFRMFRDVLTIRKLHG